MMTVEENISDPMCPYDPMSVWSVVCPPSSENNINHFIYTQINKWISKLIQWKPLIVITLVRSQYDHYKRLITITELSSKCHLYRFSMRTMETDSFSIYWIVLWFQTQSSQMLLSRSAVRVNYCTARCADLTQTRRRLYVLCRRCILSRLKIKFETNCFIEQQHRK